MADTHLDLTSEPPEGQIPEGAATPPEVGRKRPRRKRPRALRIAVKALIAIVILWVAGAAVITVLGIRDASRAMRDLQLAKSELTATEVVSSGPNAALNEARQQFSAAKGWFDSPLLTPAVIVPIIGRQVTSVRDLAEAATEVSGIGTEALTNLKTVLDSPHKSGPARVAALDHLTSLASETNSELAKVNPGPSGDLLGPLASRYNQFVDQVQQIRTRLSTASVVAGALSKIIDGPSNYLLLVANNAEMRAGSGMFLEAGLLSFNQGHVKLGTLVDTGTIPVPAGEVPLTGDFAARWAWLKPSQDWRNLGLTPNFNEVGPVATQMWDAVEHEQVSGVIALDVQALQDLLEVTGPVTLSDGTVVSSSGVVQLLLHDEYEGITFETTPAQLQRVSRLGSLAKATLDALQDRSLDLKTLATAMSDATAGRHIMLWSSSSSDEQAWVTGGVAGELGNNSLLAAVVSRSGTKLDQYLTVKSSLEISPGSGSSHGTLAVTLTNSTPPGQSPYIAGPYPGLGTVYGEYIGFLAVNLPADASRDFYATGASGPPVAWGAEGPVWLLAVPIDVKEGRSQTVVVHFEMPGTHGSITVEPSARIPAEAWSFRGRDFTDATPVPLSW
jgi:Protein of unknown function (DUF4012)